MILLSIDWDYFFPDLFDFDWGHNEDNPIMFEIIWSARAGNHSITKNKRAIDLRPRPEFKTFWDAFNLDTVYSLTIVESHKDIAHALINVEDFCGSSGLKFCVYNFDQHHDMYDGSEFNCGTWAGHYLDKGKVQEIDRACRNATIGCVECKQTMTVSLNAALEPVREKRRELEANPETIDAIMEAGNRKARKIARDTMEEVREVVKI